MRKQIQTHTYEHHKHTYENHTHAYKHIQTHTKIEHGHMKNIKKTHTTSKQKTYENHTQKHIKIIIH